MAIGDDALAAGMPLVNGAAAGSAPAIDDYINETRDFLAQRTNAVTPIAKGGTGATTPEAARTSLGITALLDAKLTRTSAQYSADFAARDNAITAAQGTATAAQGAASNASDSAGEAKDGQMFTSVYSRSLTGMWRSLYVSSAGLLGWVSSSRSAKEHIVRAPIDVQAVLALEVVTYHRIGADDGLIEHGLIAEDLHELGLTWLVDYGEGDVPEGVRYDLLALALVPAIQSAHARLDRIEERLDA